MRVRVSALKLVPVLVVFKFITFAVQLVPCVTAYDNVALFSFGNITFSLDGVPGAYSFQYKKGAWSSLGSGITPIDSSVSYDNVVAASTIVKQTSDVYVGGLFSRSGNVPANNVAHWNGTEWLALGQGTNNFVAALCEFKNGIAVGGYFTVAGNITANYIALWNPSSRSWHPIGTGLGKDPSNANATVYVGALYVFQDYLICGGRFTRASGVPAFAIAKSDGHSWSAVGVGFNNGVNAVTSANGLLFAGGYFTAYADGSPVSHVAAWNGTAWSPLGSGTNADVYALVTLNSSTIVAGGSFSIAGGVVVNYIAIWDGSKWSGLGSGANHYVYSLLAFAGKLYVGGLFSSIGGSSASLIASWDGLTWQSPQGGLLPRAVLAMSGACLPEYDTASDCAICRSGYGLLAPSSAGCEGKAEGPRPEKHR